MKVKANPVNMGDSAMMNYIVTDAPACTVGFTHIKNTGSGAAVLAFNFLETQLP